MLFSLLQGQLSIGRALVYVISALTVIFLTLPFHEFAHAFVADKLGDSTAKYQGRLTLNPFSHIDYLGALCIIFFSFGWARPVPVTARNFKNPKRDMALTALAGPVANIILAFIATFIYVILGKFYSANQSNVLLYIMFYLSYFSSINIYLAVFNFLPIPPLDGSRVLSVFLSTKSYFAIMKYERYIIWGVFLLIFTGLLNGPIEFCANAIKNGIFAIINLVI